MPHYKCLQMSLHTTYEVCWKNFKGFEDTGWIKIKPITIIIGANNAGKTSFIAPLLLMNQTLSSRDSTSPLIVKGNLYDGGSMNKLFHNHNTDNDIFFGFRYHLHKNSKNLKPVGFYPPGAFEVIIGKNKNEQNLTTKFVVKKETIYDLHLREYLTIALDEENNYNIIGLKLNNTEKEFIKQVAPINFIFSPNTFLNINRKRSDKEKNTKNKFSEGFQELLGAVARNFSEARARLLDMGYLGPIRDNPHRYYEINEEEFTSVGFKGENTPNLLKANFDKIKKDLNYWIKEFGFGDEIILNPLGADGSLYSVGFKKNSEKNVTNIADTGFGASQVLPLIVQALISEEETITIAEQPEIHLNPKLQGTLAELFAFMANKDQRVVIETHSEHLLLRLRTLVAKKSITPDLIAVYFIEKIDGISKIREIKIDANGNIPSDDWPDDFFDDVLKESIALASQQAKNRKKK